HPLDPHPALGKPGDRAAQKARRRAPALVGQDLDVGEPGGVIDADVAALPAVAAADPAPAERPLARRPEAAEPFDVDVDELAGELALIAAGRLGSPEAAALAEAEPPKPKRDRGERQAQDLGDLGGGHPQPAQGGDRLDHSPGGAMGNPLGGTG